jgi:hypothetical protein
MAKRYPPKLKFQVVLELLQGEKTVGQIAKAYPRSSPQPASDQAMKNLRLRLDGRFEVMASHLWRPGRKPSAR